MSNRGRLKKLQIKWSSAGGCYGTRGGTNLIFKQKRETLSPPQSVRVDRGEAQPHHGAERERGEERREEKEGGSACMREKERERESQRDQKDKGKTGGTIELCVKTPGTPFLFFFNFSISINQTKRNPKPGCLDEPEPIDQSALHLDSLTSRAAGMSRRKQSNPRQIKRKFPSCLAVPARLAEAVSPNIAAISDRSGAETAQAQLPPLMLPVTVHGRPRSPPQIWCGVFFV